MRAVLTSVSEGALRERRARGLDHHDEMWEGDLHMVPAPVWDHQDIVDNLGDFLRDHGRRQGLGVVRSGVSVHDPRDPDNSCRIPDLSYVAAGHASVIRKRGIVGPADAVIEVRSPDDETYEKFPFYARLRVPEIVVVHRDSRKPEVYRLAGKQYVAVAPAGNGWVTAEVLRIRLRLRTVRKRAMIELRSLLDPRHRASI